MHDCDANPSAVPCHTISNLYCNYTYHIKVVVYCNVCSSFCLGQCAERCWSQAAGLVHLVSVNSSTQQVLHWLVCDSSVRRWGSFVTLCICSIDGKVPSAVCVCTHACIVCMSVCHEIIPVCLCNCCCNTLISLLTQEWVTNILSIAYQVLILSYGGFPFSLIWLTAMMS